jgi:flagellar assembly factor FliW
MTINLDSSRFGAIEVAPAAAIEFADGLIGLGGTRYTLIAAAPDSPLLWLHSLDDGSLALPVTDPHRFFPEFRLEIAQADADRLGIDERSSIDVYVTVRTSSSLRDFAANQRAPIIIHAGRGAQVINQAPGMRLRAPLFPPLLEPAEAAVAPAA